MSDFTVIHRPNVWQATRVPGGARVRQAGYVGPEGPAGAPGPNTVSDSTTVGTLTSAASDAASVLSTNAAGDAVRRIPLGATGRSLLGLADAAAGRSALGLATVAATGAYADLSGRPDLSAYQPLDADLTAIAALTTTAYGRSLLTPVDAAAGRTLLGLGTAATQASTAFAAASHTHPLSALTQSGATTGQVVVWSGSAWVPATVSSGGGTWGSITGTLSSQTDLQTALNARAVLASANTFTAAQTVATTGGYPTFPLTVTHAGLAALNVSIVAGTGTIWEAAAGFGALNIRSDTIRLQRNNGTTQFAIASSTAWADAFSTTFSYLGANNGLLLAKSVGAGGAAYDRVHMATAAMQVTSVTSGVAVPVGMFEVLNDVTTKPTARFQAVASQTADALQIVNSSGTAVAGFAVGGGFRPASMTDAAAPNNTVYFSTTASRLVYKDSGGTVNNLY